MTGNKKQNCVEKRVIQTPSPAPRIHQHPRPEDPCVLGPHTVKKLACLSGAVGPCACLLINGLCGVGRRLEKLRDSEGGEEAAPLSQFSAWDVPPHRVPHSNLAQPHQDKRHCARGQVEGLTPGLAVPTCPWVSRADRLQR